MKERLTWIMAFIWVFTAACLTAAPRWEERSIKTQINGAAAGEGGNEAQCNNGAGGLCLSTSQAFGASISADRSSGSAAPVRWLRYGKDLASIPLPAEVWLVTCGIVCLVGLNRKK